MGVLRMLSGKKGTSSPRRKSGFTLIEMAAVMVITGALMSGALIGVPQYLNNLKAKQTQRKMDLVMNALSVYSQRNFRLPCPADTVGATRGTERSNGYCFQNASDRQLYSQTEGVVPWKALGLAERDVIDGWGHYITYKPAPQLTANTYAPEMQSANNGLDIHNACRTKIWYNADGTIHVNRQKALFCCNSSPKESYLNTLQPGGSTANVAAGAWRRNSVGAAGAYGANDLGNNDPVVNSNAWIDDYNATDTANGSPYLAGGFGTAFTADADASLLRASGQAVTLISHGSNGYFSFLRKQNDTTRLDASLDQASGLTFNGAMSADEERNVWPPEQFSASMFHPKASGGGAYDRSGLSAGASDDMVAWARSDQLFSRAGNATCVRPTTVNATCPLFNYGNMIYVLDDSGSMSASFGNSTRIDVAKRVFRDVLPAHINGEARNDPDPDNIGFTGLTWDLAGNRLSTVDPNTIYLNTGTSGQTGSFSDPDVVQSAIAEGNQRVNSLSANKWTPLFDTILQSAAIVNNDLQNPGTEAEPTAVFILSDGYDNASGMGTTDGTCGPGLCGSTANGNRANKIIMLDALVTRGVITSAERSSYQTQANDTGISRETLFGTIVKTKYPNMVINIVDVASNLRLHDLTAAMNGGNVNGGSHYLPADDEESLRQYMRLLSGVCENEVAGGP